MLLSYIMIGIIVNMVIGAAVWASIDLDDQRFYHWYCDAPIEIIKPLILSFWPVGLFLWIKSKKFNKPLDDDA